eukprot:GHVP01067467.1.p1 GENE.GHVP01067467.1~~GHVP01067467.1.p1  ORF type:complete len:259 (+),score=66.19 GHVP01067467.1:54-779(+)
MRVSPEADGPSPSRPCRGAAPSDDELSEESTSTLSTSSDDSSLSFVEEAAPKRITRAKAKAVSPRRTRAARQSDSDSDDVRTGTRGRARNPKELLVSKVLRRWWYALPDWPPLDYDYATLLAEKNLKQIELEDWEEAMDVDEHGKTKVYQITGFPGVFRDPSGNAIDLRPRENKPCYNVMMEKTEFELYEILLVALENQVEKLKLCQYQNTEADELEIKERYLRNEIAETKTAIQKKKRRG